MTAVAIVNHGLLHAVSAVDGPHLEPPAALSFPPFRLDFVEERLWKDGRELHLRRKPFAILRYLALHPRRLVTHSELTEGVWGKVATSESLLRTHVHRLRQSLAEPVIETVLGRGYRFVAKVTDLEGKARVNSDEGAPGRAHILTPHVTPRIDPGGAGPIEFARVGDTAREDATCRARAEADVAHATVRQLAELLAASSGNATVFVIVREPRDTARLSLSNMDDTRGLRDAISACPSYESLVTLWAGELVESEGQAIEEHLFQCESCAAKTQRLDKIVGAAREGSPIVRSVRH